MEFLRKVGLILATTLLFLTTVTMIMSVFVVRTIGDEDALKQQLEDSGIYDAVAVSITGRLNIDTNASPSEQALVNQAIDDSLNGSTIERTSESFISTTFDWLRGEVATPAFELNTNELKSSFTDSLISLLHDRLAELPACPTGALPPSDPFTATCWPSGVSIDDQLADWRSQIESDTNLIQAQSLTAADITIPTNNGQQPYYVALQSLPTYYRWLTLAPLFAGAVMLLLFLILYGLARPHEKGLKIAAITILPTSVFLILAGSFVPQFSILIARFAVASIPEASLREPVQTLITNLIRSTGSLLAIKGLMLAAVSGLLIVAYVLGSRNRRRKVKTGQLSTLV